MTLLVFGKTGQVATELSQGDGLLCLGRAEADLTDPGACETAIAASDARAGRWVALDDLDAQRSDRSVMRAVEKLRVR